MLKKEKNKILRACSIMKKKGWKIINNRWFNIDDKECCALSALYFANHPKAKKDYYFPQYKIKEYARDVLGINVEAFINGFDNRIRNYSTPKRKESYRLGEILLGHFRAKGDI